MVYAILLIVSLSIPAYGEDVCQSAPWPHSRTLNKNQLYDVLTESNREDLARYALHELYYSPKQSMALPLTLYLSGTEMQKGLRYFWVAMSYILTQGEKPEDKYAALWPNFRGIAKMPASKAEICRIYKRGLEIK
jgi:hypothetical protein